MTDSKVNFLIGTASAAMQIEGNFTDSNWHMWANTPGKIADGSSPEPATDHWVRWQEDNALMEELHLQIARISVEWARIEPAPKQFDESALERYRAEILDLKARGIRPLVTLHHFGHPAWIEHRGGMSNPDNVQYFLRYVNKVIDHLGDIVDDWITINEPNVFATLAHLQGVFPPGERSLIKVFSMLRTFAIAHLRAYKLLHERLDSPKRKITVTFAYAVRSFAPLNPRNILHRFSTKLSNYLFHTVIEEACFSGVFHPIIGPRPKDLQVGKYCDVIGINYYTRSACSFLKDGTYPNVPVNDLGWEIYPAGLIEQAKRLHERYHLPIWVTENGCADNSRPESFRPQYLLDHFTAMIESGLPFTRYYHWCFVDNWEWAEGMIPTFGIVGMEPDTLNRYIKPSAQMLKEIIDAGAITTEIYERYTQ